jgi:chromo domain-containing protein 1
MAKFSMVLVLSLIMECNVSDFRTERFEESSLDPDFATSLAMSPIMYEYGSRTELDEPKIKDKTERDAHHLIDFFSGWAFINRQRFRHFAVVTSIELPASEEWGTWGHIEVMRGGYAHFFECFKIHADKMWRTLDTSAQKPRSQQSTPVASTTPRTPNYNAHSSNTAQQSTFQQGKPSALGPSRYPAPYK